MSWLLYCGNSRFHFNPSHQDIISQVKLVGASKRQQLQSQHQRSNSCMLEVREGFAAKYYMWPITLCDSVSVMNEAENAQSRDGQESWGSCGLQRASTTGFWTMSFNSQNHTSCFSEGPTDAQVFFKEMCQGRCLLACHSAPQEYTLQRMVEVNKSYMGKRIFI